MRRSNPECVRAAWWTLRAVARARRVVQPSDFGEGRLPPPPTVGAGAIRGVQAVLRRRRPTCLVRALVLQRWYEGQGDRRDVVVGVTSPATGFRAHAWVEGDESDHGAGFVELFRRSPEGALRSGSADGRLEGGRDRRQ